MFLSESWCPRECKTLGLWAFQLLWDERRLFVSLWKCLVTISERISNMVKFVCFQTEFLFLQWKQSQISRSHVSFSMYQSQWLEVCPRLTHSLSFLPSFSFPGHLFSPSSQPFCLSSFLVMQCFKVTRRGHYAEGSLDIKYLKDGVGIDLKEKWKW